MRYGPNEDQLAIMCLVRASGALANISAPNSEDRAAALLWCGRALIHIAKADGSGEAHDLAVEVIARVIAEKEAAKGNATE